MPLSPLPIAIQFMRGFCNFVSGWDFLLVGLAVIAPLTMMSPIIAQCQGLHLKMTPGMTKYPICMWRYGIFAFGSGFLLCGGKEITNMKIYNHD